MSNRQIANIVVANLLWAFIPILVSRLFESISLIMIVFLRFFISGIVLFALGFVFAYYNNHYTSNEKIILKALLKFTVNKNKALYNIRNIYYLSILGFVGIILHIIFYFLSLKTTSIGFTMIGFQLSIIMVAFYEHGVKSERLDVFKFLYILMLVFSMGIIMYVKMRQPSGPISLMGILYMVLFAVCVSFLQTGISKDSYSKDELTAINKNNEYKIIRLLFKLSFVFLLGIALMFPFVIILYLIPIHTGLESDIALFFKQLPLMFQIMSRWEVLFLIFFSTIATYLLIFFASVNWNPYNLTYSQWNSILTIIEPIGGIIFGVLFINEYFPIEFLVIVLFLLAFSIILRYAHESRNMINACILIEHWPGILNNLALKMLKIDGVYSVQSLIGSHDLLLKVKTNSIKDLYYLKNVKIKSIEGIRNIQILFIEKIHKLI